MSAASAGDGFRAGYAAERDRRLGGDLDRWRTLGARPRTPAEEREWCLLQWRPDFSPTPAAAAHAAALWATRPPKIAVNTQANRQLWADRETEDLLELAGTLTTPVTMLLGADDPRPWSATDSLYHALPQVERIVLDAAGHAPWVERPKESRTVILRALGSTAVDRISRSG